MLFSMLQFWFIFTIIWCGCFGLSFITIGLGNVGTRITKLALNNGLQCVGGVTRSSNIGVDMGGVIGLQRDIGVNITATEHLLQLLKETKPNIIFEATSTTNSLSQHHNTFQSILDLSTPDNNANGEYFNIITVEIGFYFPWRASSESTKQYVNISNIDKLHSLAEAKGIAIIGTGVQDLFAYSLLPSLLPLVPQFHTIKMSMIFNANHPYYTQYVGAGDIDTRDSCGSFFNGYWGVLNEQIVYRILEQTLNVNMDQIVMEHSDCVSMFNYDEKILCVGCVEGNDQYYVETGKTIGINMTFTAQVQSGLLLSVSFIFGLFNNLNAMSVDYNIIGPYNHQSLSFAHVDDYLVTANSVVQRVNDAMNGKGIVTDGDLSFIHYHNGRSNFQDDFTTNINTKKTEL